MSDTRIKNDSYFVVHGWMINELGLKGTDLQVFAIIHGFSHAEENEFRGSIQYLCDFTNTSRPTVINALKRLVDAGFICKREEIVNGVTFNRYKAALRGVKNLYGGSKDSLHNNIVNNTTHTINSIRSIPSPEGAGTSKTKKSRRGLLDKDELKTGLSKKQETFIKQRSRLLEEFDFSDKLSDQLYKFITMLAESNSTLPDTSIRQQLQLLQDSKLSDANKVQAVITTIESGWKSIKYALNNLENGSRSGYNVTSAANETPQMVEAGKQGREARQREGFDYLEGDDAF